MLTIIQIIENVMLLGIDSMEKYQDLTKDLQVCDDSLADVFLLQLVVLLKSIVDYGFSVVLNENWGDIEIKTRCLDYNEIINIWMPFIH